MGKPLPLGVGAAGTPPFNDWANAVVSGAFTAVGPSQPFCFLGGFNLVIWASISSGLTTTAGSLNVTVASGTGLAPGVAVNSVNVPPGTTLATINTGTGAGTLALPSVTAVGHVTAGKAMISGLNRTSGLLGATVSGTGIPTGATVAAINTAAVAGVTPGVITLSVPATITSAQNNDPFPLNTTTLTFALGAQAITVTGADANASYTGAAIDYTGSVQLERSFDGGSTWLLCGVGGSGAQAVYANGTPISVTAGEPERNVAYRLNCTSFSSGPINYRISETGAAALSLSVGLAM